jgi:hypothetical protein
MARQKVSFVATKTVKRPATVRFKTKTGKTVSFKAFKTAQKRVVVNFRAKKK